MDTVRIDRVGFKSVPAPETLPDEPSFISSSAMSCPHLQCSRGPGLDWGRGGASLWGQESISPHSVPVLSGRCSPGEHLGAFWRWSFLQPLCDRKALWEPCLRGRQWPGGPARGRGGAPRHKWDQSDASFQSTGCRYAKQWLVCPFHGFSSPSRNRSSTKEVVSFPCLSSLVRTAASLAFRFPFHLTSSDRCEVNTALGSSQPWEWGN